MFKPIVYIAGRFEAAPRLRRRRRDLLHRGFRVEASWLDEEPGADPVLMAMKDTHQVSQCGLLILDTLDEDDRGGREVEFGIALAGAKKIWVVGPRRNIFHRLAENFTTWEDLWEAIDNV